MSAIKPGSGPALGYDNDYAFIVSGAHRKPTYAIGTPSISRHLTFWRPHIVGERPIGESQWIHQIELLILAIYDRFIELGASSSQPPWVSNLQQSPNVEDGVYLSLLRHKYLKNKIARESDRSPLRTVSDSLGRYEAVHLEGIWFSLPVSVRIEVFEEYFTLTLTIDFSRIPSSLGGSQHEMPCESGEKIATLLRDQLQLLARMATERLWNIKKRKPRRVPKGVDIQKSRRPSKFLFLTIWKIFDRILLNRALSQVDRNIVGAIFADFRNLSLRRVLPAAFDADHGIITSAQSVSADLSPRVCIEGYPFQKGDDVDCVDAIFPILLAIEPPGLPNHPPAEAIEYCFSKLNERCIYGSGFGAQSTTTRGKGEPLTYITLFAHDERREIGRVLNRLHTLGTARHAALYGLSELIKSALNDGTRIDQKASQAYFNSLSLAQIDEHLHYIHKLVCLPNEHEWISGYLLRPSQVKPHAL